LLGDAAACIAAPAPTVLFMLYWNWLIDIQKTKLSTRY